MKGTNKHVLATQEQIYNTLQTLSKFALTRITKNVVHYADKKEKTESLTWDNHVSGRHNAGASFTNLDQYVSIYETGAYHCIIFDGSIIRVHFKFHKNILLQENLLYWPAPIKIDDDEVDEYGIRQALDAHLSLINSAKGSHINMRSPLRFDFDSSNNTELHPVVHVHLQHNECRLSAKKPICFNTFIKFVFLNFYNSDPLVSQFLKVLNCLSPLNYSGYEEYDKAIICL